MDSQGNERTPRPFPTGPCGDPCGSGMGQSRAEQPWGAHCSSAHQRSRSLVPPVSRWDFRTLVLPLLVLSPAPFPHLSRTDPAVRAPRALMFPPGPAAPRACGRASLQRRRSGNSSRTDGAAGTAPSRARQHPGGIRTSQTKTLKRALGSDTWL